MKKGQIALGKKQGYKNIVVNLLAFIVQLVLSLYVSPLVVSQVGAAAYGFVGLAQDFVSYAGIIATVFNSVAARFITDAYYRGDKQKANQYFNSLIITNIIISSVIGLAGALFIPNLEKIYIIENSIVFDVKLTFALVFLSYIVTLCTQVFSVSTFVTNRIDIQGIRNIIQYFVRFGLTIIFLSFISVRIYWIAVAMVIANAVIAIMNISLTNKLTPDLKIDPRQTRGVLVKELALSGCWMAISSLSTILIRGFDLTIANLFLGDYEMGLLSVARTLPNNVTSVISTLASTFVPVFIALYTKDNIKELVNKINDSVKTMSIVLYFPITGFVVFSNDFYRLWQSSLNNDEVFAISVLSILTVVQAYFNATTLTLHQVPLVTNKLKIPVLVSLTTGILSIGLEIILIKYTSLGIYAIVVATTILLIIQYVFFIPMYSSHCLKIALNTFYATEIKSWLMIPILFSVMKTIKLALPIYSWNTFFIVIVIAGFIGYVLVFLYFYYKKIVVILKKLFSRVG